MEERDAASFASSRSTSRRLCEGKLGAWLQDWAVPGARLLGAAGCPRLAAPCVFPEGGLHVASAQALSDRGWALGSMRWLASFALDGSQGAFALTS